MDGTVKRYPRFRYNLSSQNGKHYGFIWADDKDVCKVADANVFYAALGFTEEMRRSGIEAEYFIWSEYHKDGAEKTDEDLQLKITEYLVKHCNEFENKLGQ